MADQWVTLLAALLGAGITFIGQSVQARRLRKSEQSQWLKDQMMKIYLDWGTATLDLAEHFSVEQELSEEAITPEEAEALNGSA